MNMLLSNNEYAVGVQVDRAYKYSIEMVASIPFVVRALNDGTCLVGVKGLKDEVVQFLGGNRIAYNWKVIEKLEEWVLEKILTAKFGDGVLIKGEEKGKGQIAEQGELFPPGA